MVVISYNVNGIRAAAKKGFADWLRAANPDVLCLQEIKALESQAPVEDLKALGYEHQYWFPAEKKGYSGVALLSKTEPDEVVYGTGISYMDQEGRNLRADFGDLSVMSLYLPSGTHTDRLSLKFQYMDDFLDYVTELRKCLEGLVICGDYNICHRPIDIHDPVRNKKVSGFLPEEREWLGRFVDSGFIDSYRHFYPEEPHQYTWWSYRANARANNKGWRIDYAMADERLGGRLQRAQILPEAHHSDHCPILLEIE